MASSFESEPVTIVAMDLGVKESSFPPKTVRKAYKPYFVWGQLINWYKQSVADPGATLNNVSRLQVFKELSGALRNAFVASDPSQHAVCHMVSRLEKIHAAPLWREESRHLRSL